MIYVTTPSPPSPLTPQQQPTTTTHNDPTTQTKNSLTAFILKTGLPVDKALSIWVHASSVSLEGPDSYVYVLPEILTDLTLSRHEALKNILTRYEVVRAKRRA